MEAISKHYEAPTSTVVDLKFKGLICQSPEGIAGRGYEATDANPFGN